METPNPTPEESPSGSIAEELHNLGRNLYDILRTAWESQESKKLQSEIKTGLNDVGDSLSQAFNDFAQSPTGQGLKTDVEDLGQRIRTGEMENKLRSELYDVLQTINAELKKVAGSQTPPPPPVNPA